MDSLIKLSHIVSEEQIQRLADTMFDLLSIGRISREEYKIVFNLVESRHQTYVNRHMRGRVDYQNTRSLGEYALQIYNSTLSQQKEMEDWVQTYASKHFVGSPFCLFNNGIDNSGKLIIDLSGYSYQEFKRPDYKLMGQESEYLIEYKDCPTDKKATYKVDDLTAYIAQNAWVLTVHKFCRETRFYTLLSPAQQQNMLDKLSHGNYKEVGYKPGVQMYLEGFVGKRIKDFTELHLVV